MFVISAAGATPPYSLEVSMVNTEKTLSNTSEMIIGKTRYIVTTHFKENGRETAEDKLLKFVTDRISRAKVRSKSPSAPLPV